MYGEYMVRIDMNENIVSYTNSFNKNFANEINANYGNFFPLL